ncbi:MAG: ferric iron uptake transcriptional regulator, partial [Gammaproteobacteria bacterium]|nr:ferric iron uptake transcriptional regulator [Gammaproteobacteria bacterium]
LQHEIAEQHGYELIDHDLVLYVRKKSDNGVKK